MSVTGIELRNPDGFEVCCLGTQCTNDNIWIAAPTSLKTPLSITLAVPASCVSQQIYGIRYLWRETPCQFKQAAVYSASDANLPTPPYITIF
ncbi:unnamed protein product [Adineta steineri]|uniref:Uncharacterized protein n=1 Tax=Adineta steineri TaxID=433720 RepID=A0A818SQL4_9BILA|nr:unnamed protein product [Adineta steineri]CAF3673454.1 unnamed protein product [Adineta steineri]CAF3968876.1 unnamed protein product [Adineta steineri]